MKISAASMTSLEECLRVALLKAGQYNKSVLLFSPAAKSFEKFKNEYDRGEQFNDLVGKLIKKESKIGKKKR